VEAAHGDAPFEQGRPVAAGTTSLEDNAERRAMEGVDRTVAAEWLIETEVSRLVTERTPLDLLEVAWHPAVDARCNTFDGVDRDEVLEQGASRSSEVCGHGTGCHR
jgi:hypothetical protein